MFSYLQFLLKSTNQHSVHSPFVYNYITKGLYQAEKHRDVTNKTNRWLLQSLRYFKPNSVCISDQTLLSVFNNQPIENTLKLSATDLIFERHTLENQKRILLTINNMNSSQLLLIAAYNYPKAFFDQLRKNPEITLVVDFYYGCLLSKRIEQPKQNFFIRY